MHSAIVVKAENEDAGQGHSFLMFHDLLFMSLVPAFIP
jgi:hypothetical protein